MCESVCMCEAMEGVQTLRVMMTCPHSDELRLLSSHIHDTTNIIYAVYIYSKTECYKHWAAGTPAFLQVHDSIGAVGVAILGGGEQP